MSSITEQLRQAADCAPLWRSIFEAAADEIERLQALSVEIPTLKTNSPDTLPPVGSLLLIDVNGQMIKARRTGYIESKSDDMWYETEESGELISGRFRWCYV